MDKAKLREWFDDEVAEKSALKELFKKSKLSKRHMDKELDSSRISFVSEKSLVTQ